MYVFFGKEVRSVPADLTIMTTMGYAGYTLKRAAAAVLVSAAPAQLSTAFKGVNRPRGALPARHRCGRACMLASIPFFPTDKRTYDINKIKPEPADHDGSFIR